MAELLDANITAPSQLYSAYNGTGPQLGLILPALLLNAVSLPGMFCNGFLLYVTFRTKALQGATNWLLALISLFELAHQSSYLLFLAISLSGINFVPLRFAFFLQLPAIFGFNGVVTAILSVALDRLFVLLAPKIRDSVDRRLYLSLHVSLSIAYSLWMAFYILQAARVAPDRQISNNKLGNWDNKNNIKIMFVIPLA